MIYICMNVLSHIDIHKYMLKRELQLEKVLGSIAIEMQGGRDEWAV